MKLTTEQKLARDAAVDAVATAHDALVAAIETFNESQTAALEILGAARAEYNAAIEACNDSLHVIGDDINDAISEKSEKWQESDAGGTASDWASEWVDFCADEFEFDEPNAVEVPESPVDAINDLQEASE